MDVKSIQTLIQILEESSLESMHYKDKTFELEIRKAREQVSVETPKKVEQKSKGTVIKSPLVGIFYSKSAPDASAFISVGQQVHKGDILCIIESMKTMNEFKSPVSGSVIEVHIQDGQTVDFDQPLFTIQ